MDSHVPFDFDKEFIKRIENLAIVNRPEARQEYNQLPKLDVCPRKGHGLKGEPIQLLVNWYRMIVKKPISIFIYEVNITEEARKDVRQPRNKQANNASNINRDNARISFWRAMRILADDRALNYLDDVVFDDTNAFLPYSIRNDVIYVNHPDPKINEKQEVKVCLRCVGKFPIDPLSKNSYVVDFSQRFIKALVTQRMRYPAVDPDEIEFRKNWFFNSGTVYRIPHYVVYGSPEDKRMKVLPGIRAWFGLYASLKTGGNKELFVNFGLMNSLFYRMDLDLMTFYIEVCKEQETDVGDDFAVRLEKMGMDEKQRQRLQRLVQGMYVKSSLALSFHNKKPFLAERHFKITEIGNKCPSRFKTENGRTMEEVYKYLGYPLRYPYMPIITLRQGSKSCSLPMEVLCVHDTPQKYSKALDFLDTRKFIKNVCRNPTEYKKETDKLLSQMRLQQGNAPFLSRYGVELDVDFAKCTGKVLHPPVIRDHEGQEHTLQEDRSYRIKEVSESAKPIVMDCIITLDPFTLEPVVVKEEAARFFNNLQDKMRERGLQIDDRSPEVFTAQYIPYREDKQYYDPIIDVDKFPSDYRTKEGVCTVTVAVKEAQEKFKSMPEHESKRHIILTFSSRGTDFYGRLKRICDRLTGVVTQNVDRDTVQKALIEANIDRHAIFFNLALKINGKLGGINMRADVPIELHSGGDDLKTSSVMYVGIDVTHPGIVPGRPNWDDNMDASIAAIVGSYDYGGTRYKTYYMAQMKVKETVERFDSQFHHLMMDFFEKNNAFPKHIVIYRDGVSDSEMIRTCCIELNSMKGSWKKIVEETNTDIPECPTFTYIVVQKRHYTRFLYPKDRNGTITYQNVPSGTVVDEKVVSSKLFDFWLTAQHGALGTSRPIHYTVVYKEWNEMTPDQIYEMTYRLCFLNARCRKPCALPAPVLYAHLACLQGKEVYRDFLRHSPAENATAERQARVEEALNVKEGYPGMPFV